MTDTGFEDIETALEASVTEARAPLRFRLVVTSGRGTPNEIIIDEAAPSRVLVGKSPVCSLIVDDPEVSRRHFSLEATLHGLRISDLDSTNGTRVEGLRVREAWLSGGETIRIGQTTFSVASERFEIGRPGPANAEAGFGRLIGQSSAMRKLYPLCRRVAASKVPLVIEGETGTGKEVLAESVHDESARARMPFVVFDCTTISSTMLEAALFGYERGSFTGASEARPGVFEEADGGTLFIDEIGDLDISLQAKFLRAVERGEVRRVGGKSWRKVDVRIIAATRRDLDKAVAAGLFRDDLFFRLAVARIELPPLRRRDGDIRLLANHLWKSLEGPMSATGAREVPEAHLAAFEAAPWPGNVRELVNTVARLIALGDLAGPSIAGSSLPARSSAGGAGAPNVFEDVLAQKLPFPRAKEVVMGAFERRYVEDVLALHGGNVRRAAEASGIARRYFQLIRAKLRRGFSSSDGFDSTDSERHTLELLEEP